ncbi:MAG: aminoacyl-tRNA hydrolase [Bacteroidales bacterium]|nr:aminoacyl-tRNA hydrolase [Bacteroidales bacterium]
MSQSFQVFFTSKKEVKRKKKIVLTAIAGRDFSNELHFSASKSQGPGGQHVNKVCSKVELRFHPASSSLLTDAEKELVMARLKKKLTESGYLIITSQSERSQHKNKQVTADMFYRMLNKALLPKKVRKPTKRTLASIEERLETKRKKAVKKTLRKKPAW